jgi:hypothetical protein
MYRGTVACTGKILYQLIEKIGDPYWIVGTTYLAIHCGTQGTLRQVRDCVIYIRVRVVIKFVVKY